MTDHPFERFVRRMGIDDSYRDRLLVTIEIARLEAQYQQPDKPPIFRKTFDDLGLVLDFAADPTYEGRIPHPRTRFDERDYATLAAKLEADRSLAQTIDVMLVLNQVEHSLSRRIRDLRDGPVILRTYDETGFPIDYQINPVYIGRIAKFVTDTFN